MTQVMSFTAAGLEEFQQWLTAGAIGGTPKTLLDDPASCEAYLDRSIDLSMIFSSRYAFGCYLSNVFHGVEITTLLAPPSDGMWAWINAVYFAQLAPQKPRRFEHYIPVRRGSAGSLLHRNAARTAFELVSFHGENARFTLQQKMSIHGQLLESLSASQSVARNRAFFGAAAKLYMRPDGTIRKGATNKVKKLGERRQGDESGKGAIRRLPTALKRLDLTFDVERLTPTELLSLLPREFARWKAK